MAFCVIRTFQASCVIYLIQAYDVSSCASSLFLFLFVYFSISPWNHLFFSLFACECNILNILFCDKSNELWLPLILANIVRGFQNTVTQIYSHFTKDVTTVRWNEKPMSTTVWQTEKPNTRFSYHVCLHHFDIFRFFLSFFVTRFHLSHPISMRVCMVLFL